MLMSCFVTCVVETAHSPHCETLSQTHRFTPCLSSQRTERVVLLDSVTVSDRNSRDTAHRRAAGRRARPRLRPTRHEPTTGTHSY